MPKATTKAFTFVCGPDDFLVGRLGKERFDAMVAEAQGMDALLVNAANKLPMVEALRQLTREAGLGLGVYLHHRGLSRGSLGKMVEWGVDHITTQNHRYFDEFRA